MALGDKTRGTFSRAVLAALLVSFQLPIAASVPVRSSGYVTTMARTMRKSPLTNRAMNWRFRTNARDASSCSSESDRTTKRAILYGILGTGGLASVSGLAGAEETESISSDGPGDDEKPMTAIERLREKQRKALGEKETQAERLEYEDGSVTLVYPRNVLEDMRLKDPTVRQRLSSPGRGGLPREGFPYFVRDGYKMKMFIEDDYQRTPEGLFYKVLVAGRKDILPKEGQKVVFEFTAYNENGDQIDSSIRKAEPPSSKIGLGTIVPGVEIALKQMKIGERRRIIVSPNFGPPTGPQTFFSAKQFETFDIELMDIKDCVAERTAFVTNEKCVSVLD